jgi:hypothetical protein
MKTKALLSALAAAAFATQAHAQRTVVYTSSFETQTPDPHWSNYHWETGGWANFTDFNGRFTNSYTEFSIAQPQLPDGIGGRPASGGTGGTGGSGGQYAQFYVTFDLYTIDAWYGTSSNDRIIVTANNTDQLFNETFSTMAGFDQTFRAPDVGPVALGFASGQPDAIYRQIELPFGVDAGNPIRLRWNDGGNILGSWGVDNVTVSYEIVPAPASMGALAGLGALGLRRRRR